MSQAQLIGEWRKPVNTSADEKGGIHDDETANQLGFEGGTIAGSIHMEQFVPLLLNHFGDQWWREGGLSLYFRAATMDRQPVRCVLDPLDDQQANVFMENEDGDLVMQGTASLGVDEASELQHRLQQVRPAQDIRMFADVVPGRRSQRVPARLNDREVDRRVAVITEPLDCYEQGGQQAFGGRVAPMASAIHAFRAAEPEVAPIKGDFVGMFGAIEIQFINGPILSEHDYLVEGEAVALSESPKTEILWHRHWMYDAQSGLEVARMIKMDRLLKGASPLWS